MLFEVFFPVNYNTSINHSYRLNRAVLCDTDINGLYPYIPSDTSLETIHTNPDYHLRTIPGAAMTDSTIPLAEREGTIFVATLLSYTTPSSNGTVYGNQAQLRNTTSLVSPAKKIRTGVHSMSSNSKCMMLGDCSPNSDKVLCLILPGNNPLYGAAGQTNYADSIRVGDVIGILEPEVSTRALGGKIPIIESFTRIVPLKQKLYIPSKCIKMSSTATDMTHFCGHNLTINFSMATFLTNRDVPCTNITCDRQNTTCRGCRGKDITSQNYVVNVHVQVHNQHKYENTAGVATFLGYRSFHLTKQLIDVAAFASLDVSAFDQNNGNLRRACRAIAAYVNANGGWTLIGWHRRGVTVSNSDGSVDISSLTKGHIIRLEPTCQTPAMLSHLSTLKVH